MKVGFIQLLIQGVSAFFFLFAPLTAAWAAPTHPIVFVTQVPWPADFATINSTFANHLGSLDAAPRGGDLYIRYPDGNLKNITFAAGFGSSGMQGASSIAVRDPSVHWSGEKIIFSMLIGAPTQQYQVNSYYWQLYEVTGIGQNETPVITKVSNQPANYNNISPLYGTDERIIFISDRPRNGGRHLYPQLDEYESTPTNTGLWSLSPSSGDLKQLDHAPSGDFNPIIDSFGRVIFTRWDHLQRDQQNRCSNESFEAYNFSSEAEDAVALDSDAEVFPEARAVCEEGSPNLNQHSFNLFLPWQINEDGTELETLNHIGRHELTAYLSQSFNDDPNIMEFYGQYSRHNQNSITNLFQLHEDQNSPGRFLGINAPEFGTHAAGQIVSINGAPSIPADQMEVTYLTHEDTASADDSPSADHIGFSRDPIILSDGALVASHTSATREDSNIGSGTNPASRYDFRLKSFSAAGGLFQPGAPLTPGITKTVSFWSPDELITFTNVTLWELQAKEVIPRARPTTKAAVIPDIEKKVFNDLGVSIEEMTSYLQENSLALVISRDVTTRDILDRQQPTNLKVAGSETATLPSSGKVYEVAHLQFFQGDQIRAYGIREQGRRVIAQIMHEASGNPENPGGPEGSVKIASDGSVAAFVPARRALTYQTTDEEGNGVVRERLWLTFQPGEIRVCASCHGVNSENQLGQSGPTNEPLALKLLLEHWKSVPKELPSFDLEVRKVLKTRRKASVKVTGNEHAKNKLLSLALKVGRKNCGVVANFSTNESGSYLRTFRAPASAKKKRLEFNLLYQEASKDSVRSSLAPRGVVTKSVSNGRLCKAFLKALE